MNPVIFILLPVHNRLKVTEVFINCLKSQSYKNYHLILIDDGSTDGTEEMVRKRIDKLTVLKGNGDLWWAGALQKGYLWLKRYRDVRDNDIIFIANDDIRFDDNFLQYAKERLNENNRTVVSAKVRSFQTNKIVGEGLNVDLKRLSFRKVQNSNEINCLSTWSLFIKYQDFMNIGGFYPERIPHFLSDYEYSIRAFKKKYTLVVDNNLVAWVNEETSWNYNEEQRNIIEFIRYNFSNRCSSNPIHWTFFCLIVCPNIWKLINVIRIWYALLHRTVMFLTSKY